MGGKASLFMVLGFSLIFMVAGYNYGLLTTGAIDNNMNYFEETIAHNIAVSGANIASNQIFFDKNWKPLLNGYNNKPFEGGTIIIDIQKVGTNNLKIISTGKYNKKEKKVEILLQPSSFAKFAYYMNIFPGNLFFVSGDTITGPFHTQGKLAVSGSPVFQGKASAKNGLKRAAGATPKFYAGYESGVDIPINWDISATKSAALSNGYVFNSGGAGVMDVRLRFNSDATVTYAVSNDGGNHYSADSTKPLSSFTKNGMIYLEKGNFHISGTVSGKYTLFVDQSSGTGSGNVYIEDDVKYKTNPLVNPTSTDMLGIVCSNNIKIVNNAANRNNVEINASIFSLKGGIEIEDQNMPVSGTMKILGGLIEYQGQVTGKISGGALVNGYRQRIIFDERLLLSSPPYFPTTSTYEIISWLE